MPTACAAAAVVMMMLVGTATHASMVRREITQLPDDVVPEDEVLELIIPFESAGKARPAKDRNFSVPEFLRANYGAGPSLLGGAADRKAMQCGCGGPCCGTCVAVCMGGCCKSGWKCCPHDKCCENDYPVCCDEWCCSAGYCSSGGTTHECCAEANMVGCKNGCCPQGSKCTTNGNCCNPSKMSAITAVTKIQYCATSEMTSSGTCKEPFDPSSFMNYVGMSTGSAAGFVTESEWAVNEGSTPEGVGTIKVTYGMTQETTQSYETSIGFTEGCQVTAGIPDVDNEQVSFSSTQTFTNGNTNSKSTTTTMEFDFGSKTIAPFSRQMYTFNASLFTLKIPFVATVTMLDACGGSHEKYVAGNSSTSGIAGFAVGKATDYDGPVVPVECTGNGTNNVWCPGMGATCSSNPLCERYDITTPNGDCCPTQTQAGEYYPCCAIAQAHPSCIQNGWPADTMLCPALSGVFDECCDGADVITATPAPSPGPTSNAM